jgi:beta-glucosidase
MNKLFSILIAAFFTINSFSTTISDSTKQSDIENKIDLLLKQMTIKEKIAMMSGDSTGFNSQGLRRLGIPSIRMSDGPVGVRTGKATAYPVSVNMAASWDTSLVNRFGKALAEETAAKAKDMILGPCVGIHRYPLNGRNFESFGEDPFLSARMAVNYIKGVQSKNIIATVKHFACNDQEWERNNYNSIVDQRSLHEIHLVPFEAAVTEAGVNAVMTSYNLVNGEHASENRLLVHDILKHDWNFKGFVVSDWVSVYCSTNAANNGVDIEMPSPMWYGDSLLAAIAAGNVSETTIDDKIRRQLRVRFQNEMMEKSLNNTSYQEKIETPEHKNLALEMAQKSIILLKNDGILPLSKSKIKSIAVIGPNSADARTGGGGSSFVEPWEKVSPFEGISQLAGKNISVVCEKGISFESLPFSDIPSEYLFTPDGSQNGLMGEYFNNRYFEGKASFTRIDKSIHFDFGNDSPDNSIAANNFSIRWIGLFVPPQTGLYHLATTSDDGSLLFINDTLVVDNSGLHGDMTRWGEIQLKKNVKYKIRIDYVEAGGFADIKLGWFNILNSSNEPLLDKAITAAKNADVTVLCLGLSPNHESEGIDVESLDLQNHQDDLLEKVLAVNPNTILVLYGGVPFNIEKWQPKLRAIIHAGYPGQEGGTALAQILFGDVNPSAKLPFSYIQKKEQSPAFVEYKNANLQVSYNEGVFVGYRFLEKNNIKALYPFGFGLSYSSFRYSNLVVKQTDNYLYTVSVNITNTGNFDGEEIAQLYVQENNPTVARPLKELKAFSKVFVKKGETKTVSMNLSKRSFAFWNTEINNWTVNSGIYTV